MPYDSARLEQLSAALQGLKAHANTASANALLSEFLELYRAEIEQPSLRQSPEVQQLLQSANEQLPWLDLYGVGGLETFLQSEWHGPEWVAACWRRTAIEGLNEHFLERFGEDRTMDTEDVDRLLRSRAESDAYVPPGEKPEHLPESHWWWKL